MNEQATEIIDFPNENLKFLQKSSNSIRKTMIFEGSGGPGHLAPEQYQTIENDRKR